MQFHGIKNYNKIWSFPKKILKKNLFYKKFFKTNKSIYKYFSVGIFCTSIDYISTLFFLNLTTNLFFSNSIGYLLGSLTSYIGHSKFTFKNTSKNLLSKKQIFYYVIACLGGIICGFFVLKFYIFINLKIKYAKFLQIIVIALVQYYLNSKFTFKRYN